jgi:hypothetical protein
MDAPTVSDRRKIAQSPRRSGITVILRRMSTSLGWWPQSGLLGMSSGAWSNQHNKTTKQ